MKMNEQKIVVSPQWNDESDNKGKRFLVLLDSENWLMLYENGEMRTQFNEERNEKILLAFFRKYVVTKNGKPLKLIKQKKVEYE